MIRTALRWLLAILYAIAGYLHLAKPAPFLSITPGWVPAPELVIAATGIAELLGAIALLQPWSRTLRLVGGWGLALYAICVFPANINHFATDMARDDGGLGLAYHIPRMVLQPILVWLSLWVSGAVNWPFSGKEKGRAQHPPHSP